MNTTTLERPTTAAPAIRACPACTGTEYALRFTKKGRDFWRCRSCGLELIHPLPTLDELREYYDRSYDSGMYRDFVDADPMKRRTAAARLDRVRRACPGGRWLDVGCSNGLFVSAAVEAGIDAEGIDLSEVAVRNAQQAGVPVFQSTIEDWDPPHRYDALTLFDVLEHVLDPIAFLESARRLLAPGGTIVLTVPNQGSWVRRLMGKSWYFYIPEEHLHYFNPRTIRLLLDRVGFDVVRTGGTSKPLTWDYSVIQFEEYLPPVATAMKSVGRVLPRSLRNLSLPLPIGEMLVVARRREGGTS